jgi:hypothetical protein
MRGLSLALFIGCMMSGLLLLLAQLFFVPFELIGTGGIIVAACICAWVVFKAQQSVLYSITRWRVPLSVIALSAVPGLVVGFAAIRAGLGLVTGAIPGCAIQALVLRLIASTQVIAATQSAAPAPGGPVVAPIAAPVVAAAPAAAAVMDAEPALMPDASNPAAPRYEAGS